MPEPRRIVHPSSNHPKREQVYRDQHTTRVLAGIAASLALLLVVVKFWPLPADYAPTDVVYTTRGPETIQMEEIVQTNQRQQTPPPPAPLPPVVVPNDVVIEEVELDFSDAFLPIDEPGADNTFAPGLPDGASTTLARVDTDPKPVRIVEPEYTRAAKRKKIRAEVVVEVLVDEKGQVQESKVVERFLLGDDEGVPKQAVDALGYGLEEAALSAADRWLFRPARKNGTPVSSYHALTFRFGV